MKLKSLRLEAGLSQAGLARLAGIDRGTLASAEQGKGVHELTESKIANALSKALGKKLRPGDIF